MDNDQISRAIAELSRQLAKLENSLDELKANIQIFEETETLKEFRITPQMVPTEKTALIRELGMLGLFVIPLKRVQDLLRGLREKYLPEKFSPLYEPLLRAKTLCKQLEDLDGTALKNSGPSST